MPQHLPFSSLTDEEFLAHLYRKVKPTDEDLEAATRIELLLNSYARLLEQIHTTAVRGLRERDVSALSTIKDLTAPAPHQELMS